jgi:hypothetical protein
MGVYVEKSTDPELYKGINIFEYNSILPTLRCFLTALSGSVKGGRSAADSSFYP